jgi:hypothetical protein
VLQRRPGEEWKALFTDKRSWEEQVWSGFFLAVSFVVGFAVYVSLLIGLGLLCFLEKTSTDSFAGRHQLSLGVTLVAISTAVMFATVRRWVKALPGFIGYGVIGGEIIIMTGHMENSSAPVSRWVSIPATALCLLVALLAKTIADRDLRLLDRVCLMAFVYGLTLSAIFRKTPAEFVAPAAGVLFLILAWAVDRYLQWEDARPDYHLVHGTTPRPPVRH